MRLSVGWSIRAHLAVLVLAVLLPVVVLALVHARSMVLSQESMEVDRVRGIVRSMADRFELDIGTDERLLDRLANAWDERLLGDEECPAAFADPLGPSQRRNGLWMRSGSGRMLCGRMPVLAGGRSMAAPAGAQEERRVAILGFGDEADTPLLVIERLVHTDTGRVAGVIGVGINLPQRTHTIRPRHGMDSESDLVTAFLAEPNDAIGGLAEAARGWTQRTIPALDPAERYYAIERIPGVPVWAVAGVPVAAVWADAWSKLGESLGGIALALILSAAAATWFARRIQAPVEAIATTADAVRSGRAEARVCQATASGVSELALVGRQLDRMLDSLAAERARLAASEAQYRLLFREMLTAFALHEVVYDEHGQPYDFRYIAVNPLFVAATGFSEADIVGKTAREVLPNREEAWFERYLHVATTGEPLHIEEYIPELGQYFDVRAYRTQPGRFAVLFADVTAKRRAEMEMARLNERVALATDAGGVGIWEVDLIRQRIQWDERMCRMHGFAPRAGSMAIDAWAAVAHPDDLGRIIADYRKAVEDGGDFTTEYRVFLPKGDERVIRAHGVIHRDADGNGMAILGTSWDVTEQRQAMIAADEARAAAEAANAAKDRFLQNMSHELRTPLNAIQGFAQVLEAGESEPRKREYLSYVCRAASDLLSLIERILDLSDLDAGRYATVYERFSLEHEMEILRGVFAGEVIAKGLEYRQAIAPDVPYRLLGDPGGVRQILVNLIGNAVKFTPSGFVHVAVERAEGAPGEVRLAFIVTDSGIGIAAEARERIFEIFEQEEGSMVRRFGGMGLGLAISKRLVARLGGTIGVESEAGKGACFRFTLPFANADAANASGRGRILIAEADPNARRLFGAILGGEDYELLYAADAAEAALRLEEGRIDLVVLGAELGLVDGCELTRWVREGRGSGCPAGLPVIAVVGSGGPESGAVPDGVTDCLHRPMDARHLIDIVEKHLPRKAA